MKHDIVFKTKEAYISAKTLLTHHFACRFNDLNDFRIEFYLEGRRNIAKKMLLDMAAVEESEMEYVTG
tara:strand:+ start:2108 stop:2311 length:204 start_codon:yes stop_codon:yes gene_type:complete